MLKAFYIVYFIATNKQGIPSTELSRKSGPGQKTCWRLKRKVMKAMAGSHPVPLMGNEMMVGQQEEGTKGRQNQDKKLVAVAVERAGKGIRGATLPQYQRMTFACHLNSELISVSQTLKILLLVSF